MRTASAGRLTFAGPLAAVAAALVLVLPTTAAAAPAPPGPDQTGAWTEPFEEGGAGTPRCVTVDDNGTKRLRCKPAAVHAAALPDGRVLYYNGLESQENVQITDALEFAPESRDSQARVLSLAGGTPTWTTPSPETGGMSNPNIRPGHDSTDDLGGMLGVPGRPGDGLVGSLAGRLGLPPGNPTSSPDDAETNDGDLFCTDVTALPDGRLLLAGGTDWYNEPVLLDKRETAGLYVGLLELEGLRTSLVFDPATDTFTPGGTMKYGRWYPELVALPDGKVLVAGGVTKLMKPTQLSGVRRTETYDPGTNTWAENYTGPRSETALPTSARLHLTPNGKVFYGGVGQTFDPEGEAADEALWALQKFYDPATATWDEVGVAPLGMRGGAFEATLAMDPPHDTMQILTFGGTLGPTPSTYVGVGLVTLTTIDASGKVKNKILPNMNRGRWFPSGVPLPDGTVLAVNGGTRDGVLLPGTESPVRTPELFDPVTQRWRDMAPAARDRTYHNSALLLADGRVLVGGHAPIAALDGAPHDLAPGLLANNDRDPSFEIFSPPYLFRGDRPVIVGVQSGVSWGQAFPVATPRADEIESVVLMRLPSPQHVNDSDQRTLRLPFTTHGNFVQAVAPRDGVAAPPGHYYLFILRRSDKGPIPSTARIIHVGPTSSGGFAPQPFPDAAPAATGSATPPEDTSYLARPPKLPLPGKRAAAVAAPAPVEPVRFEGRPAGYTEPAPTGWPRARTGAVALVAALGAAGCLRWLVRRTRRA